MVSKQPVVAKLPAKQVADEQDCSFRGEACHVSLIGSRREWYGMAGRLAIPFEPGSAAFGDRHRECCVGDHLTVIEDSECKGAPSSDL